VCCVFEILVLTLEKTRHRGAHRVAFPGMRERGRNFRRNNQGFKGSRREKDSKICMNVVGEGREEEKKERKEERKRGQRRSRRTKRNQKSNIQDGHRRRGPRLGDVFVLAWQRLKSRGARIMGGQNEAEEWAQKRREKKKDNL
jgi:hypothetical protein